MAFSNVAIAELLALAADHAKMPLQKALRRASRKAFMWTDEAADASRWPLSDRTARSWADP